MTQSEMQSKAGEVFLDVEMLVGFDQHGCQLDDSIISKTHNRGMGYSWNWGIQNATREFVIQMEDDWWQLGSGRER